MIHKTAIISEKAEIAKDVEICPFVVIEAGVKIGAGTKIGASSCIYSGTTIGERCNISNSVTLGGEPQDLSYKGYKTFLKIGDNNTMREYVHIQRGADKGSATVIGNNNFFMSLVHIGHDTSVANNTTIASGAVLAGRVEIHDRVFISGNGAVSQFVRIGELAMIGGLCKITKDVPPFMRTDKHSTINYYNVVGIKRASLSDEAKKEIRGIYKKLFRGPRNLSKILPIIEKEFHTKEAKQIIQFIKLSKIGISTGPKS